MISIKFHRTESIFVTRPSSILFVSGQMCTFQPRNFTGIGSDGIKACPELKCIVWGAASSHPDPGKEKGLRGRIEMIQLRIEMIQLMIEFVWEKIVG